MRLTLRTLLAYLDNILEPSAAQAMAAKIEESSTAAELVHRIRDVTKKVRLAAPTVDGKGLGLDANTVAEYLDNTLTGDTTPDFERVCLESDVHLAEVAACHEILSLVLVQPAEIDPATRQKMYGLLNQTAAQLAKASPSKIPTASNAPIAPVAVPVAAAVAATVPAADGKPKREVPEYLKGSVDEATMARRGWALAAVAFVALLLVAGTFALAVMPIDSVPAFLRPLAEKISISSTNVAQNDPVLPKGPPSGTLPVPPAVSSPTSPLPSPTIPVAIPLPTGPSPTAVAAPTGLLQPPSAVSPSADVPPSPLGTAPLPPLPSGVVPSPPPNGTVPVVPPPVAPLGTATGTAVPPTVVAMGTAAVIPVPSATGATPVVSTPTSPDQPAKIEPVGRVSSAGSQVLLRFDPKTNAWVRLPARETLSVGDRILALPGYRPQVALGNGLTIDLLGGTLVELLPVDASGTPGLSLLRGRLMLFTVGGVKGSLRIENGKLKQTLSLTTAEMGLEYVPRRAAGEEPSAAAAWGIVLHGKSGQIGVATPTMAETQLTVPGQWWLSEVGPPESLGPVVALPSWITSDDRDLLEKQAADFVELGLRSDKAVSVALREMASDRRAENVQLALRCQAQIGEFDDFMSLLRDPTQRYSTWERYVQMLVEAIDFGPEYATKVREALIRQHGPEGEALYRILWGYSDEQLKSGAAKYLVETLDHPELDYRVIAIWTLCDVTGQPAAYLPQDQQPKRKTAILKWEQKLKDGQIVRKKA
jgi:hypothetical protein